MLIKSPLDTVKNGPLECVGQNKAVGTRKQSNFEVVTAIQYPDSVGHVALCNLPLDLTFGTDSPHC